MTSNKSFAGASSERQKLRSKPHKRDDDSSTDYLTMVPASARLRKSNLGEVAHGATPSLYSFLKDNEERFIAALRELVSINSFTRNLEGVAQVSKLTELLFGEIGFRATHVESTEGFADHLVLESAPLEEGLPSIGLISHHDTVFPPEEEAEHDFHWREEAGRLYGPGTCDIKGGTIVALATISAIKEAFPELYASFRWVVLINSAEEVFAKDFPPVMRRFLPEESTLCALVFELGRVIDGGRGLVVARKGRALFDIEVRGRSAHSGVDHEKGANAIEQLSRLISKIASFSDYSRDLTFNVGVVSGGTVVNRVPHFARCEVEMRCFDRQVYEEAIAAVQDLTHHVSVKSFEDGFPCTVYVRTHGLEPPLDPNGGPLELLPWWQKAGERLGVKVVPERRGGLSDANRIAPHVLTIDGLGPLGANDHCSERTADGSKDQEYAWREGLLEAAMLNATALEIFLRQYLAENGEKRCE